MNARSRSLASEAPFAESGFAEVAALANQQLGKAAMASGEEGRYNYLMLGRRPDATHYLGVFCVANGVEPLHATRDIERLRLAVPIERADADYPISVLGSEGAQYFYLTYLAKRGGIKELRIDPTVFAKRFECRERAPVVDLALKLATYKVIPMRERDRSLD